MLDRQREMLSRTRQKVAENPAPAMLVVGLGMVLIAGLAAAALFLWNRRRHHTPASSPDLATSGRHEDHSRALREHGDGDGAGTVGSS
jgi:hypothetical protein